MGLYSSALFLGARGLGKTKLSEAWLKTQQNSLAYNLLDVSEFKRLLANPSALKLEVQHKLSALDGTPLSVLIDEVQKIPELLDVVHLLIEEHKHRGRFLLTGSSARKLKSRSANLLASRALGLRIHPFTQYEIGRERILLTDLLQYGSLDYFQSFYSTGSSEVDLVLSRSRYEKPIAIEVKSNPNVHSRDLQGLVQFAAEYPDSHLYCIATNSKAYDVTLSSGHSVKVLPYFEGIAEILGAKERLQALGMGLST